MHKVARQPVEIDPVRVLVAMRAKAPITAIPLPGGAGVRVRTQLLRTSLRGLRVLVAEAVPAAETPNGGQWLLRIEAVGKGVKAKRLYYGVNPCVAHRELSDWATAERRVWEQKRAAGPQPQAAKGTKKHVEAIIKLEKRLTKLRDRNLLKPPECRLLVEMREGRERVAQCRARQQHERELMEQMRAEGSLTGEYSVAPLPWETWAMWKREARLRRRLWHLAKRVRDGDDGWSMTRLYREVQAMTGCELRRWGAITERERERAQLHHVSDYLKRSHEFCGLTSRPRGMFEPHSRSEQDLGPLHYRVWLERLHEVRGVEEQIRTVRELMEAAKG